MGLNLFLSLLLTIAPFYLKASDSAYNEETFLQERLDELQDRGHVAQEVSQPQGGRPFFGIVGDSLAVGAMAAEQLSPHGLQFLRRGVYDYLIQGENTLRESQTPVIEQFQIPSSPVVRIFDTPDIKKQGTGRFLENRSSQFIDCEECAFTYTLAKKMGFPSGNILVAGQSGKRVDTIAEQFQRLSLLKGELPEIIVVSYTANDICHQANSEMSAAKKYEEYYKKMVHEFSQALKHSNASQKGSQIYVVAAADIGHLLENEKILTKELNHWFPGGPNKDVVTCREIREQSVGGAKHLADMCPYVLHTKPDDHQRIAHIQALHQAVVTAQRDTVEKLNEMEFESVRFHFLDSILDVPYGPNDISSDCFHPSTAGHDKMAKKIYQEIMTLH